MTDACSMCQINIHYECLRPVDVDGGGDCCCGGVDFSIGFGEPVKSPKPSKSLAELDDPVSTGRKRALQAAPIFDGMVCEWAWLKFAGGGVVPIIGCDGNLLTASTRDGDGGDLHHGPDKNTLNNTAGVNLHRICKSCLAPETLVLTADLRWVRIDTLQVGDELVGFDEQLSLSEGRLKRAVVEHVEHVLEPSYRTVLEDGTEFVSSHAHQWVASSPGRRHLAWRQTEQVYPGVLFRKYATPWQTDTSWEAGWLAGMYDGEGSLTNDLLSNGQRVSPTLDRLRAAIESRVERQPNIQHRPAIGNQQAFTSIRVANTPDIFRILGSVRPPRLLTDADKAWVGKSPFSVKGNAVPVVLHEPIGPRVVVSLQTSTRTLIANGYLTHNCHHKWHKVNDPFYGDKRPAGNVQWLPTVSWLPHNGLTKASDAEVAAAQLERKSINKKQIRDLPNYDELL